VRIGIIHSQYRSSIPSGENFTVADISQILEKNGHLISLWSPDPLKLENDLRLQVETARAALSDEITPGFESWISNKDIVQVHNYFPLITKGDLGLIRRSGIPITRVIHNYRLSCLRGNNFRNGKECNLCSPGRFTHGILFGCYNDSSIKSLVASKYSKLIEKFESDSNLNYVAISDHIFDYLKSVGKTNVFTIQNSVPGRELISQSATDALFVGRLEPEKGILSLLELWNSTSNLPKLHIVGEGSLRKDVESSASRNSNVRFHGLLNQNALTEIATHCKIAVIPGLWKEPFGRVLAESLSRGQAIVASHYSVSEKLLQNGVNGYITGLSASEIEDGIRGALTIPTALHLKLNRKIWEDNFSPKNAELNWATFYSSELSISQKSNNI
jgi:glycosyltransferase involved in cell wall biosynthesis